MLRLHDASRDSVPPAPLDALRAVVAGAKELLQERMEDPRLAAMTLVRESQAARERCSTEEGEQRAIVEQLLRLEGCWARYAAGERPPPELRALTEVLAILVRHLSLPLAS